MHTYLQPKPAASAALTKATVPAAAAPLTGASPGLVLLEWRAGVYLEAWRSNVRLHAQVDVLQGIAGQCHLTLTRCDQV